ncbi:MAG: sigma-54 interaction domain-containing protein, partial [Gemmatimonadales bacterium]
ARLIAGELPADLLLVRRIDLERMRLETASVAHCGAAAPVVPPPARTDCTPERLQALLAWCRQGTIRRGEAGGRDSLLETVAPLDAQGGVMAGPLGDSERPLGLLVALADHPNRFNAEHEALLQSLLEPATVALINDARLQELTRLRKALEADNRALLSKLDRQDVADAIVGSGSGLRTVMECVEQVAHTDTPVLILGETGTGKEVIARAIHAQSRRASGPVVRVNCGALPPGLVDSELFGHERGSFTGAVSTRLGVFERADGGTLFLDEIGELPVEAQVRLLRILQDGTFERVGGQRSLSVDVRVVAATHRDLQEMVERKTFREDLWYRIGIFPIRLPSLRERPEDIPALAAHFGWRAGNRLGGGPLFLSPGDIELLVSYPWPGNVRELAAVIERAAILGDGRRLDVSGALGTSVRSVDARPREPAPSHANVGEVLPLGAAMARHIECALGITGGRIEGPRGAASLLGINPHTLRARMRKLGVNWRRFRRQ